MKGKLPLVSVIVPTYREELYIEKCLTSIRRQSYKGGIELIVVDSNSPDMTREIAQKYADNVINLKERGIAKARNAGVNASKGELLLFVDADTVMSENFVERCALNFERHGVVCAASGFHAIGGTLFKRIAYRLSSFLMRFSVIIRKPLVPTMCVCYGRKVFDACNGFDENLNTCEDFDLSKKVSKHGKIAYMKDVWVTTSPRRLDRFSINLAIKPLVGFLLHRRPIISIYPHVSELPKINNFTFILNQLNSYGNNLANSDYYHRNYQRFSENMTEIKFMIKRKFQSIRTNVRETFLH